jgi:hypothetical protein
MKRSKELKRDMEARLTGNYASVAGNSGTARECAGFEAWIQTNYDRGAGGSSTAFSGGIQAAATDGTQRAYTETLLKNALQLAWTNGGDPTMIMVGAFNKKVMSGFSGIADQVRDTGNKRATIVGAADVYVSDFGQAQIRRVRISKTGTSVTNASVRLHLFTTSSITATNGDNGAWSTSAAPPLSSARWT